MFNLSTLISVVTFAAQNFPALARVVSDLTGIVTGSAPAAHENTGTPAAARSTPNETIRAGQKLLNQYVKPVPPLVEDGLFGKSTEAAMRQGLTMIGIKV